MARSRYIYVVEDEHWESFAAFTVKYEMLAFLKKQQGDANFFDEWMVSTFRDGAPLLGFQRISVPQFLAS